MPIVTEVIRVEQDQSISFGNYTSAEKQKADNFEMEGDIYKVKTHKELTRLEKNEKLLLEAVPGAAIHNFKLSGKTVTFNAEGFDNTQLTLELEPEKDYKILVDGVNVGSTKSNFSGKISFSLELSQNSKHVRISS